MIFFIKTGLWQKNVESKISALLCPDNNQVNRNKLMIKIKLNSVCFCWRNKMTQGQSEGLSSGSFITQTLFSILIINKKQIKLQHFQASQPHLTYFHCVGFGCCCTSAISSLASCSLSGLLAHSSLASVSLFFCSTAWASCQRCHAFIRWSNDPCRSHTHTGSFHVYI